MIRISPGVLIEDVRGSAHSAQRPLKISLSVTVHGRSAVARSPACAGALESWVERRGAPRSPDILLVYTRSLLLLLLLSRELVELALLLAPARYDFVSISRAGPFLLSKSVYCRRSVLRSMMMMMAPLRRGQPSGRAYGRLTGLLCAMLCAVGGVEAQFIGGGFTNPHCDFNSFQARAAEVTQVRGAAVVGEAGFYGRGRSGACGHATAPRCRD